MQAAVRDWYSPEFIANQIRSNSPPGENRDAESCFDQLEDRLGQRHLDHSFWPNAGRPEYLLKERGGSKRRVGKEELDRRRTVRDLKGLAIGYSAGTGFGAIDGWPPELTMPEPRFRPSTPEVARSQVRTLTERGIGVLKIWVDDFGGKVPKLPVPIIQAIIDEARRNGIKTFAHIFFLRDAIDVVDAGIHVLAHSVRDTRISKTFADKMAQQDVILAPTLVREEAEIAFAGEDNPYFENALFRECAGTRLDQLRRLRTGGDRTRDELSRKAELALVNFETLSTAGVMVCLSTDSGFNLLIGIPLNRLFIPPRVIPQRRATRIGSPGWKPYREMFLLAFVFASGWFVKGAMAAHLPRLLEKAESGATHRTGARRPPGDNRVAAVCIDRR